MEDLEAWAQVGSSRKLAIIDEIGKSLRRRTPMSKLNIEFLDKFQILRKYKLSIIMIAPDEKYIDSAGLGSDVLDAIVVKPEFNNPKKALYEDLMLRRSEAFSGITRTSIKFDTWDIAPFTLKRKIDKATFNDPELRVIAMLGEGKSYSEIGEHPQKITRIIRKFCKTYTENITHNSQK